jgi:hypothetical protein
MNKITLTLLGLLLICSLAFNYWQWITLRPNYYQEKSRLINSSESLKLFESPMDNYRINWSKLPLDTGSDTNKKLIKLADNVLLHLKIVRDELLEIQGGVNPETGGPVNPYSVNRVNSYFYTNNAKRPIANQFILKPLVEFRDGLEKLGLESSLKNKITIQQVYMPKPIFQDLNIVESLALIDLLSYHIYYDTIENLEYK